MSYEIDFLPVGDGERSGDAIAMRFGDFRDREKQTVIVIDGGFKDSGENLVDLIKTHYYTDSVDLVVSTHPHEDHINGLEAIVGSGELSIKKLLMHQPWNHDYNDEWKDLVKTARSFFDNAKAKNSRIIIEEPTPQVIPLIGGNIRIFGPTLQYYKSLLLESPGAPKEEESEDGDHEEWDEDTIVDSAKTSAANNTSVIMMVTIDNSRRCLFTGDAGIDGLTRAAISRLSGKDIIQIPHHGSKHNVGPAILNEIVGEIVGRDELRENLCAVVSCAEDAPKHPSQRVINAFIRRGVKCFDTIKRGTLYFHSSDVDRDGYSSSTPLKFDSDVSDK